MFIKDVDFNVNFSDFSEKHFKKKFQKKYPAKVWEITEKAIIESLKRIYRLKDTDRLDCIKFCEPYGLLKFDLIKNNFPEIWEKLFDNVNPNLDDSISDTR